MSTPDARTPQLKVAAAPLTQRLFAARIRVLGTPVRLVHLPMAVPYVPPNTKLHNAVKPLLVPQRPLAVAVGTHLPHPLALEIQEALPLAAPSTAQTVVVALLQQQMDVCAALMILTM